MKRGPSNIITLKIDGQDVGARSEETILEVARENGIEIPTLCHLDGLSDIGGCRLCMVEVKGSPRLFTACMTSVQEGMEVTTHSPRLDHYRRMIVEMLFSERNHVCAVCVSNGHCDLQDLAIDLEVSHVTLPYLYPKMAIDASHARFVLDHNRCVLCTRCVRVCDEVEGAHTWDLMGRGVQSRVISDLAQPWGTSESCTSCGKCVHVCPTGALFEKGASVSEMTKRREFLPYLQLMRKEEK
jgi:bidirectional [NiFe] hydrogenase diaphorase subunit